MYKSRIFTTLNRNIAKEYHYSFAEIQVALSKEHFSDITKRESMIYSSMFKEFDPWDFVWLYKDFEFEMINIRTIFLESPYSNMSGLFEKWFDFLLLDIKDIPKPIVLSRKPSPRLLKILGFIDLEEENEHNW